MENEKIVSNNVWCGEKKQNLGFPILTFSLGFCVEPREILHVCLVAFKWKKKVIECVSWASDLAGLFISYEYLKPTDCLMKKPKRGSTSQLIYRLQQSPSPPSIFCRVNANAIGN